MKTLVEIDALCAKASALSTIVQIQDSETQDAIGICHVTSRDGLALNTLECEIECAIAERMAAPVCPFCHGAMQQPPIVGRLDCIDCGAHALAGFSKTK